MSVSLSVCSQCKSVGLWGNLEVFNEVSRGKLSMLNVMRTSDLTFYVSEVAVE